MKLLLVSFLLFQLALVGAQFEDACGANGVYYWAQCTGCGKTAETSGCHFCQQQFAEVGACYKEGTACPWTMPVAINSFDECPWRERTAGKYAETNDASKCYADTPCDLCVANSNCVYCTMSDKIGKYGDIDLGYCNPGNKCKAPMSYEHFSCTAGDSGGCSSPSLQIPEPKVCFFPQSMTAIYDGADELVQSCRYLNDPENEPPPAVEINVPPSPTASNCPWDQPNHPCKKALDSWLCAITCRDCTVEIPVLPCKQVCDNIRTNCDESCASGFTCMETTQCTSHSVAHCSHEQWPSCPGGSAPTGSATSPTPPPSAPFERFVAPCEQCLLKKPHGIKGCPA